MRPIKINALLVAKCLLAAAGVAIAMLAPSVASGQNVKESFSGFAINMNSGPKTGRIDFTIERWSTDAERDQLLAILKEEKDSYKVNQQLLKALQKMPKVGYIRTTTSLAWDLRYARQNPLPDGGRRIVFATDRPIGFREAANQPRSMDYPFTVVEMQFDKDDKGVGKILPGTKIFIDKDNNLVLENYAQQPVRFNEIKKVK
jgi:hypothetical protein